jgi:heme-degrading monooxygenase HmoA
MYIAMNRFTIANGRESDFEAVWRDRKTLLPEVPGFLEFKLLCGQPGPESTMILSHSTWESEEAFRAWTNSDAFKKAHESSSLAEGVVLARPQFEGYSVVI